MRRRPGCTPRIGTRRRPACPEWAIHACSARRPAAQAHDSARHRSGTASGPFLGTGRCPVSGERLAARPTRPADPPKPAGRPPKTGWPTPQIRPADRPNPAGPSEKSGRPPGRPRPKSGRAAGQIRPATRPAEAQIRLAAKSARLGRPGQPRGRRAGPARIEAGPYVAGGWPGGRPWRPAGWPRGGTGGRPAIQSVLSGGCVCVAPCVRAPTPCNRPRPACALPRVLTRRRSDLCASSLPGRGLSACSIRMLPPAPPECLLPPSAPRHRAPSAPGTCRRRWLERGRRACPSRSTTRTCPTPRTTAAVPPRRHRRSCLPLALGGGTTSWPRTRTVVLRRLQAPLPPRRPLPPRCPRPPGYTRLYVFV